MSDETSTGTSSAAEKEAPVTTETAETVQKKTYVGAVTSAKRDKTLRVEIARRFPHPMYGKIIRRRTVCHVHDEENKATEGDLVEIVECRPRSKTKTWELVRVVGHED